MSSVAHTLSEAPGLNRRQWLRRQGVWWGLGAGCGTWTPAVHAGSSANTGAAAAVGTVTVVEGQPKVIRGTSVHGLLPGMRLAAGDLIHVDEVTSWLRIEHTEGRVLELSAQARVWVAPRWLSGVAWYVQRGWFKWSHPATSAARLVTPHAEVRLAAGTVMGQQSEQGLACFAESGAPQFWSRPPQSRWPTTSLHPGDYLRVEPQELVQPPAVASRPPGAWLATMPGAFRDTLPSLLARYPEATPWPKPMAAVDYGLIAHWLQGEPLLRRAALERWRALAHQREFRAALQAHLKQHPEWDPVLNPPPPRRTP